jgi:hypothetical protein
MVHDSVKAVSLVPGGHEREDLVAQLGVGQPLARLLVVDRQQHRQQVARVAPGLGASCGKDPRGHLVEVPKRPTGPEVPRRRDERRPRRQVIDPVLEEIQGRRDRLGVPVGFVDQVDSHQCPAGDPQRQPGELGHDVERLAGRVAAVRPPPVEHRRDSVGHPDGQRRDPLVMEGRLRHPAQPSPGRPLGRHQALAQDDLRAVVEPAPRVVPRVVQQHPPDMARVSHQVEDHRAEPNAEDVAVDPHPLEGPPQRVATRLGQPAPGPGQRHHLSHPWGRPTAPRRHRRHDPPPPPG